MGMQSQDMSVVPMRGRVRCSRVSLPVLNMDRLRTAKALVDKAVKERKVFSVQGPYPVIRAALRARGWVERHLPRPSPPGGRRHGDQETEGDIGVHSSDDDDGGVEGERDDDPDGLCALMSRLVRNETTYFYWTTRRDTVDCRSLQRDQMTNHYARAGSFTTKVGLCMSLRNLRWFDAADPDTFFPRCYRLEAEDEKQSFIEDFRRTACTSLLQFVVEQGGVEREGERTHTLKIQHAQNSGRQRKQWAHQGVGPDLIDNALHVCQEYLNSLEHCDIDTAMETPPTMSEQQWAEFIHNCYRVVHEGVLIESSGVYVERCKSVLNRMQQVCPQLETDGLHNIWIIKPGAKSRGRGIVCMNRLDEILRLVEGDSALSKDSKWVVQKYVERPLLVHGTKFDVRQWFLVTDWNPLTVWFYRECYLRFSTQPYSTHNLDSSVHLCNNSIQRHFLPCLGRDPSLPMDCMWSCAEFRAWLAGSGREFFWEKVVVPGMQRAVIHTLLTAQDSVEPRRASFELYGADFILGRDLRPWLLEVNSSPTMTPSTRVTARLCPAVQRDTLRVVLDRRTDRNAWTGGFQLIYKQAAVEVPQYVGVNLLVEGAPIRRPRLLPRKPVDQSVIETGNKPSNEKPLMTIRQWPSGKKNQSVRLNRGREGASLGRRPAQTSRKVTLGHTLTFHPDLGRRPCRLALATSSCIISHSFDQCLPSTHKHSHTHSYRPTHKHTHTHSYRPTHRHTHSRRPRRCSPSLYHPSPSLEIFSLQLTHAPSETSTQDTHAPNHTHLRDSTPIPDPILRMHQYLSRLRRHDTATCTRREGPQSS